MSDKGPKSTNTQALVGAENMRAPVISSTLAAEVPKLEPEVRARLQDVLRRKEQAR